MLSERIPLLVDRPRSFLVSVGGLHSVARAALALAVILLVLSPRKSTLAQAAAQVCIATSSSVVKVGDTFEVRIEVSDASRVYAAEIQVSFDPSHLQVVDADSAAEGVQLIAGPFLNPGEGFLAINTADNSLGVIQYALTLLAPAQPVHGSGLLATITFQALESGQTNVVVEEVLLSSEEGESLPLGGCESDIAIQVQEVGVDTPRQPSDGALSPEPSAIISEDAAEASDTDLAEEAPLRRYLGSIRGLATGVVCLSVAGVFLLAGGLVVWFVRGKQR